MATLCVVLAPSVYANPSIFSPTVQTSSATTTVNFMSAGNATTTLTLDTYYPNTIGSYTKSTDAILLMQFAGSSTSATLNGTVEYSQDCIDYYSDNYVTASTSPTNSLQINNTFSWLFASTTIGGGKVSAALSATSTKAIRIYTPTRCVRVVLTQPVGSASGAIWAQLVPNREKPEGK